MSIRLRLFLVIFGACLFCAGLYSVLSFYSNMKLIRKGVDAHLQAAAQALNTILPADYHDRVVAGVVSPEEYLELQKRVREYQERVKVTFLYSLVMHDGALRFAMDDHEPLLSPYENPAAGVLKAFELGQSVIDESIDIDFNTRVRSVVLPYVTEDGVKYLVGADLDVDYLRDFLREGAIRFLALSFAGLILALVLAFSISHFISAPLITLSQFAHKLADENFSPNLHVPQKLLPKKTHTSNEISYLALSFQGMLEKLDDYLANFKREVEARERVESEFKIAGRIQASLLPPELPETPQVQLSAFMRPAKEAGGDLYDYFFLDEKRLLFAVGDVSGKGMPAALLMARAMTLIRSAVKTTQLLPEVAALMNEALCAHNDACMFVTFFIGVMEPQTGEIRFVNCGHNPPAVRRLNGDVCFIKADPGCVLGIDESAAFPLQRMYLEKGELLFVYTDGVTEAMDNSGKLFGETRLLETVRCLPENVKTETAVSAIIGAVEGFSKHCDQADDITLLCIKRG